jgi:hypothetical protein
MQLPPQWTVCVGQASYEQIRRRQYHNTVMKRWTEVKWF